MFSWFRKGNKSIYKYPNIPSIYFQNWSAFILSNPLIPPSVYILPSHWGINGPNTVNSKNTPISLLIPRYPFNTLNLIFLQVWFKNRRAKHRFVKQIKLKLNKNIHLENIYVIYLQQTKILKFYKIIKLKK